jgi:TolB-like protein
VKLVKDLLERRVARYFVAYCAAGWAVLEVADMLAENGMIPAWGWRATFVLFLSGLPGAVIVSWFHGARGRQEVPPIERWLLAGVGVVALVMTGMVVRSGLAGPEEAGPAVTLETWQDPSRVAVLYFEDRGGEDSEFLATGLTEELIDLLDDIQGLHVVSSSGSRLFRGVAATPDSIGRTLQAGTLVTGTVAMAGERVQVKVGLVNAAEGSQYASTEIERPRAEIFDLQDELADSVAVFLRTQVGLELGRVRGRASTRMPEAWEFAQRAAAAEVDAAALLAAHDEAGGDRLFDRADSLLAEAERADPSWADPATRRGWLAYRRSRLGGMDRTHYETWTTAGLEHAERALALDGDYASALDLRGTLAYWRYLLNLAANPDEADDLFHRAESDFRASIAADPNRATALTSLSHLLLNKGELAEAKLQAERAYAADPFLENANLTLFRQFQAAWNLGDPLEARRPCLEGARRFEGDYRFAQCQLMLMALPNSSPDVDGPGSSPASGPA